MNISAQANLERPPSRPARDYISHSSLRLYQTCPLRYFFKYIEGLPEEFVSASLILGGGIHAAIEYHFIERMMGHVSPSLDTLFDVFWDEWRLREADAVIRFGGNEDRESIGDTARRLLATFLASDLANPPGQVLGVEEELRGPIVAGLPDLLGRVDLILETEEAVTLIDFKTARSRWSADQADDSAEQLLLYAELAKEIVPTKPLRLQFAVLTKTTKPLAQTFPVDASPARLERTRQTVQRVWHALDAGHFYPTPSPLHCPTCPYRAPCRQWPG